VSAAGELRGEVALVTGAARGIGRAIAARLAAEGASVAINYPPGELSAAEETLQLARGAAGDAAVFEADIGEVDSARRLVGDVLTRYGRIDVLVNNAGICPFADVASITPELWQRVLDVNLKGAFFCAQAVARSMVDRRIRGRIVNISSISAWVGGTGQLHYCASKAGVSSITKSLALAFGPHGIRTNAVLPGTIETDINRTFLADPDNRRYLVSRNPLGRLGQPDDIAGPVFFLVSRDSSFVNGAELLADGGTFVNYL
jgi:L-rhamnose 1-dehydrogenase